MGHNHELCPVLPVGILYKITQMDYFTVIFLRLDHGLNTFLPFSEVLLNACIPTVQLPFGTFLNVEYLTSYVDSAYSKMIEDNTSGIAALISANTRMALSNGQMVNSYEKFQIASGKAASIMEELRVASTKTYATFPQLTGIYQQMIGHTMSMGDSMGKTVNEISTNTIELSKILSNIGGAIGMEMQKVNEEARSIISGSVSTDSLIAMMVFGSPT